MILSINVKRSSLFYVQDDESQNAPLTVCKMLLAESENAFPTERGAVCPVKTLLNREL